MASEDPNRQDAASPDAVSDKPQAVRSGGRKSAPRQAAASAAPSDAATSPAEIEAAVARLTPQEAGEATADTTASGESAVAPSTPEPHPDSPATTVPDEARPGDASAPPPVPPSVTVRRTGPSPWLALPIGALAGALAAGAVAYGLVETGTLRPAPGSDMQPLLQRLSALEQRPRQDLAPSVAQLDTRVAQLEASGAGLASLRQDVSALKQGVDALTASVSQSATLAQQAAGLSGQVSALSKKVDDLSASSVAFDRSVAAVVALGALREAVQAGRPFTAELDAARRALGPASGGALDPLAGAAAQGYPAPARLATRLQDAARAKPAAAAGAAAPAPAPASPEGGGLMDRLLSSAESLVRVGATDAGPGAGDQSSLDGAAAALRAGDMAQALSRIDALSPETKAKVASVVSEITARRDAAATLATLNQQALAAISGKLP